MVQWVDGKTGLSYKTEATLSMGLVYLHWVKVGWVCEGKNDEQMKKKDDDEGWREE